MTTMMFNVDEKLKIEFSDFAKKLGTNPSNLMRMFISHTINTKKVSFEIDSNFEIEPLDTSNWGKKFNDESYELTKKMSSLLKNKKGL